MFHWHLARVARHYKCAWYFTFDHSIYQFNECLLIFVCMIILHDRRWLRIFLLCKGLIIYCSIVKQPYCILVLRVHYHSSLYLFISFLFQFTYSVDTLFLTYFLDHTLSFIYSMFPLIQSLTSPFIASLTDTAISTFCTPFTHPLVFHSPYAPCLIFLCIHLCTTSLQ